MSSFRWCGLSAYREVTPELLLMLVESENPGVGSSTKATNVTALRLPVSPPALPSGTAHTGHPGFSPSPTSQQLCDLCQ